MQIGLLIIASEVLEGRVLDTNTQTFSLFLRQQNLDVKMVLTVRDRPAEIQAALAYLYQSCRLVVTSGGLGPTPDDLTKQAIADFMQRPLAYSESAAQVAADNYLRMGRDFPGKEHGYCWLPAEFSPLPNSAGFAPGLYGEVSEKLIFSAPGVPREFKALLNDHLMSLIHSKLDRPEEIESLIFRTRKIPEEKIFGELDPTLWQRLSELGEMASLPVLMGVDLVIKLRAPSRSELEQKMAAVKNIIQTSPVNNYVWHQGAESLEEVLLAMAIKKKITFGFAESATGGLCSHRMTAVPGVSDVFMGSIISYANTVKSRELGVSEKTLSAKGVVSVETAEEMAQGLAQKLKVVLAVSITGYAGPGGGTSDKPVGTVCIGTCLNGRIRSQTHHFRGERDQLKARFAQAALMAMLEEMEKIA